MSDVFPGSQRFSELFDTLGVQFEVVRGFIWVDYSRMVVPIGPIKVDYSISEEEARFLLSRFSKTFAVRFTSGFTNARADNGWYAVILKDFKQLLDLSKNTRKKIRSGSRNCTVRRLDAKFVADHGYDAFSAAVRRYKGTNKPEVTETYFRREILATARFDDIVHYWGAFYGDRLIALHIIYAYDRIEASGVLLRLHPDFIKLYPSYILHQTMGEYYLEKESFEYINGGLRNILHQTNIQDFLMNTFKYEKAFLGLSLKYRPYYGLLISMGMPARSLLGSISPKVAALYKMNEAARRPL